MFQVYFLYVHCSDFLYLCDDVITEKSVQIETSSPTQSTTSLTVFLGSTDVWWSLRRNSFRFSSGLSGSGSHMRERRYFQINVGHPVFSGLLSQISILSPKASDKISTFIVHANLVGHALHVVGCNNSPLVEPVQFTGEIINQDRILEQAAVKDLSFTQCFSGTLPWYSLVSLGGTSCGEICQNPSPFSLER